MTVREYPSDGAYTCETQTGGTKQKKVQNLQMGQPSDIGKVASSRLYTREYGKVDRTPNDPDTVSPYLGNPLAR